jgi:hypothetical protein
MGKPQFSSDGGEATRNLKEHQERISAIETLFTIALLTFGFVQSLAMISNNINNVNINFIASTLLLILYFSTLYLSWKIGGENLLQVIRES